jgi:glycosyltransferase involved in cell wall biosynthesis
MISLDDVGNRDPEIQAFGVVRFVEKPDLSAAEAMIREGQWYWNGGIFCYSAESFLSLCKTLLPQDMPALCELQTQLQSAGLDPSSYRETFSTLTKISVDYGIMEKGLWVGAALEVEDRSEGGAHHMRILYLVDAFPYPPTDGLRLRPFNILKWFPQGHTIGLVCLEELTPGAVPPLLGVKQSFGLTGVVRRRSVINIPRRYPLALYSIDLKKAKNQLVEVLDQFRPDIINCESLSLGYGLCRWKPDVPVVNSVPDCNSLYHRLRFERAENPKVKLIELVQWLKFVNFERDCYKCFNYNVVVGERDKNELIRICGPIPITVIPNGVDCQFFNGNGIEPQTATIAFVGVMNYPPNVDAVIHFTRNVLPLVKKRVPEVRFIIAGKTPSKSVINLGRLPGVEVTGYVEDIRKIYGRTSVVVVPIRFGTGVKNKVLEAMAMSKPVVATTEAVENIPVINGENIIIANEPMAMAEETISLLKDRDRARSIGYAAREHVHKLLSWAAVGRQLLSIYEDVLG